MFDFDVNAVAAACEAALENELCRIDKGYYILNDEDEAFELEDEAGEADMEWIVEYRDKLDMRYTIRCTRYELTIALRDNHYITIEEALRYGD